MHLEAHFVQHFSKPESLSKIIDRGLKDRVFFEHDVRDIFNFSLDYYYRSGLIDAPPRSLLEEEFETWFKENDVPDEEYLIDHLIDKIKERYTRVNVQRAFTDGGKKSVDDPNEALYDTVNKLIKIQLDTAETRRFEEYAETFDDRVRQYFSKVRENVEGLEPGFYLGWDLLNDHLNGIYPGEFAVFVGFTGIGKSLALSNIALRAAQNGTKVYFASLENTKEMTLKRLDSILTGVPYVRYERGTLTHDERAALERGREAAQQIEGLIVDAPMRRHERTATELMHRAAFFDCDMIVIDQLSWITPQNPAADAKERVDDVVSDIAALTKEHNFATVMAAQFNRMHEKENKGRGQLYNIAGSSEIERIVDFAFALSATREMRRSGHILLETMKSRRTEIETWVLDWKLKNETRLEMLREYRDASD